MDILSNIKGKLIVSCQAQEDEPLFGSIYMARMAIAAEMGGAAGIRANGPNDIKAINAVTKLPIIGIYKIKDPRTEVIITPTFESAVEISEAGADIIAVDATARPRADGSTGYALIKKIKEEIKALVMADISTIEEGILAAKAGADLIGTTLSGYTSYSPQLEGPDFELIKNLHHYTSIPVVAEGRIWSPEEAVKAFEMGAWAVVVGTAITRPQLITKRFVKSINDYWISKIKNFNES